MPTRIACTLRARTSRGRRATRAVQGVRDIHGPGSLHRCAGGHRARHHRAYSAAMRRHAPPRAATHAHAARHRALAAAPRRARRRRRRHRRRPPRRAPLVPCTWSTCGNERRHRGWSAPTQTTSCDARPTAGRRRQSTSARSLAAAPQLPLRRARAANAWICEQPLRDASSLSAGRPSDVAGARQVAREHGRAHQRQGSRQRGVASREARRPPTHLNLEKELSGSIGLNSASNFVPRDSTTIGDGPPHGQSGRGADRVMT